MPDTYQDVTWDWITIRTIERLEKTDIIPATAPSRWMHRCCWTLWKARQKECETPVSAKPEYMHGEEKSKKKTQTTGSVGSEMKNGTLIFIVRADRMAHLVPSNQHTPQAPHINPHTLPPPLSIPSFKWVPPSKAIQSPPPHKLSGFKVFWWLIIKILTNHKTHLLSLKLFQALSSFAPRASTLPVYVFDVACHLLYCAVQDLHPNGAIRNCANRTRPVPTKVRYETVKVQ